MTDEQLIEAVARLWISAGGDSVGFAYLATRIRNAIANMEVDDDGP